MTDRFALSPALTIELVPSRTALVLAILIHLLFAAVCLSFFPLKWLMMIFVISHFCWTMFQLGWSPFGLAISQINIQPNNQVFIMTRQNNRSINTQFLDSSVLTRFVSVIHFRLEKHIRRITLFPDSMDKVLYQKLIIYIRWHENKSMSTDLLSTKGQ